MIVVEHIDPERIVVSCKRTIDFLRKELGLSEMECFVTIENLWTSFPNKQEYVLWMKQRKQK